LQRDRSKRLEGVGLRRAIDGTSGVFFFHHDFPPEHPFKPGSKVSPENAGRSRKCGSLDRAPGAPQRPRSFRATVCLRNISSALNKTVSSAGALPARNFRPSKIPGKSREPFFTAGCRVRGHGSRSGKISREYESADFAASPASAGGASP